MLKFSEFPPQQPLATPRRWFPTLCGGFAFRPFFFCFPVLVSPLSPWAPESVGFFHPFGGFAFSPFLAPRCWGGSRFPYGPVKKKKGPAASGGFVFLSLFSPWAIGVGLVVLIERLVGRIIDGFVHSRAHPFTGGLVHSLSNAAIRAMAIHCFAIDDSSIR